MKKILLFLPVFFICFISVAQNKSKSTNINLSEGEKMAKELIKVLSLNAEQSSTLSNFLIKSFDDADIVRTNSVFSKDEKNKKLSAIYKAREEKILSILDNSQKSKYEQFKINKKNSHNNK